MKTKEIKIAAPREDGKATNEKVVVKVPMEWDEDLEEWVISEAGNELIEDTKAKALNILSPRQLKELRHRYGLSQREMSEIFQSGEKSWARWESGKQRQSRLVNLLIKMLYDGVVSIDYLANECGRKMSTSSMCALYLKDVLVKPARDSEVVNLTLSQEDLSSWIMAFGGKSVPRIWPFDNSSVQDFNMISEARGGNLTDPDDFSDASPALKRYGGSRVSMNYFACV